MSIKQTVEQIYRDYENRDLEKVLDAMSDDFCFEWPVDPKNTRFSGACRGKGEFVGRLKDLAKNFEFNVYRPITVIVEGENAAVQMQVDLTSVHTGERFEMKAAHFWTFEDGKPVHLVEYFDSALIAKQSA
jgi:ketosteroid isomerase-like protein